MAHDMAFVTVSNPWTSPPFLTAHTQGLRLPDTISQWHVSHQREMDGYIETGYWVLRTHGRSGNDGFSALRLWWVSLCRVEWQWRELHAQSTCWQIITSSFWETPTSSVGGHETYQYGQLCRSSGEESVILCNHHSVWQSPKTLTCTLYTWESDALF